MTVAEAADLLRPAVPRPGGVWADLGAGTGTLTRALARLLGPSGRIVAVDRDASAVLTLGGRSDGAESADIEAHVGDIRALDKIEALTGVAFDGVLLANVLHFVSAPAEVLADVRTGLKPGGRIVVVEYERRRSSRWVPYPIPLDDLRAHAEAAGLPPPRVAAERRSAYGGLLYVAVMAYL